MSFSNSFNMFLENFVCLLSELSNLEQWKKNQFKYLRNVENTDSISFFRMTLISLTPPPSE